MIDQLETSDALNVFLLLVLYYIWTVSLLALKPHYMYGDSILLSVVTVI